MNRSEQINELVVALTKAQAEFKPILKETDNPAFRSKYADLSTIIAATRPALNSNGLVIIQGVECLMDIQVTKIETLLAHVSGQWISEELHLPATMRDRFDAQAVGSSQTYGRRYAMQAILGVAADVDDDGNAAVGIGSKEAAQAVAEKKIADLKSKLGKPAEPAKPPVSDLSATLQKSIDNIRKATEPKPPNPFDTPLDTRPIIKKVSAGRGKATGMVFIEWDGEEISIFNKSLFQYLKVGVPADLEIKSNSINGKLHVNLVRAISIGNVKFDENGKPMLEANREIPGAPAHHDLEEFTL